MALFLNGAELVASPVAALWSNRPAPSDPTLWIAGAFLGLSLAMKPGRRFGSVATES